MALYDKNVAEAFVQMQQGVRKRPNYIEETNTPSLWAYYNTLPKWAREDPVIRNVVMAFEYYKPNVDIRDKELALNYACSFLRPIDENLKEVIVDFINSNKIQLNMKLGNEMLNELSFYEVDPEWLGDSSDEGEGGGDDEEARIQALLSQQRGDGEEEDSAMVKATRLMNRESRMEDMRA